MGFYNTSGAGKGSLTRDYVNALNFILEDNFYSVDEVELLDNGELVLTKQKYIRFKYDLSNELAKKFDYNPLYDIMVDSHDRVVVNFPIDYVKYVKVICEFL